MRYIRHTIAGLLLAFAVVPAAHCQNVNVVPEMQYRLSPDAARQLDSLLPPLPDSVPTAHGWYHVSYPLVARCGIKIPKGMVLDGCTDYPTRKVEIAMSEKSLAQKWQTLRHEMAHIMFNDAHITFETDVLEERACDVVATWPLVEQLVLHLVQKP